MLRLRANGRDARCGEVSMGLRVMSISGDEALDWSLPSEHAPDETAHSRSVGVDWLCCSLEIMSMASWSDRTEQAC